MELVIDILYFYFGFFLIGGAFIGAVSGLITGLGILIEIPLMLGQAVVFTIKHLRKVLKARKSAKDYDEATFEDILGKSKKEK